MHRRTRVLTLIIMHYPQWSVELVAAFGFGRGGLLHNTYFISCLFVLFFPFLKLNCLYLAVILNEGDLNSSLSYTYQ